VTRVTVNSTQIDASSVIKHSEYSLDGGAGTLAFPDDGIAPIKSESYYVKADRSWGVGTRLLSGAADANVNVGSAKVTRIEPCRSLVGGVLVPPMNIVIFCRLHDNQAGIAGPRSFRSRPVRSKPPVVQVMTFFNHSTRS